jgi:hypothetical protein
VEDRGASDKRGGRARFRRSRDFETNLSPATIATLAGSLLMRLVTASQQIRAVARQPRFFPEIAFTVVDAQRVGRLMPGDSDVALAIM